MQWGIRGVRVYRVLVVCGVTALAVSCSEESRTGRRDETEGDAASKGGAPATGGGSQSGGAPATGGRQSGGAPAARDAGRSPDAARDAEPRPEAGADSAVRQCIGDAEPPPLPDGGHCGLHRFLYIDTACSVPGPPDASVPSPCEEVGDGRCYDRCTTDRDCRDPCRPYCRILGLFDHADYNCDAGVRICRETPRGDCNNIDPELI